MYNVHPFYNRIGGSRLKKSALPGQRFEATAIPRRVLATRWFWSWNDFATLQLAILQTEQRRKPSVVVGGQGIPGEGRNIIVTDA